MSAATLAIPYYQRQHALVYWMSRGRQRSFTAAQQMEFKLAYDAKVIPVMIASPSDVEEERERVRAILSEWNAIYSQERAAVLLPVGWDTHSSPELSGRPQDMINERILKEADLLVGIFWTRVGSDTGKSVSGSVEEIELHRAAGKPVLLYFSESPVHPSSVIPDQYEALQTFKSWAMKEGLVQSYTSAEDFSNKFQRQLPITLRDNSYLRDCLAANPAGEVPDFAAVFNDALDLGVTLSTDEESVLKLAVAGNSRVTLFKHLGGISISAGGKSLDSDSSREAARWKAAITSLVSANLLEGVGYKGEIFEVTHSGYEYAERRGWELST